MELDVIVLKLTILRMAKVVIAETKNFKVSHPIIVINKNLDLLINKITTSMSVRTDIKTIPLTPRILKKGGNNMKPINVPIKV